MRLWWKYGVGACTVTASDGKLTDKLACILYGAVTSCVSSTISTLLVDCQGRRGPPTARERGLWPTQKLLQLLIILVSMHCCDVFHR